MRLSLSALYLSFSRFLLSLSNGSYKANTLMKTTWVKNTLHVAKKADWPTLILQMAIAAFFGHLLETWSTCTKSYNCLTMQTRVIHVHFAGALVVQKMFHGKTVA